MNYFGVSVAAASGVGLKINTFAGMPCWTIGQAVSTILPVVTGLIYFKGKSWESKKTDTSQDMKSSLARRLQRDGRRQIFFKNQIKIYYCLTLSKLSEKALNLPGL